MAKSLVIVESPTKARTIKRFLGKGFDVEATMGHIKDLPKTSLGVDIDKGFMPNYKIKPEKRDVVKRLKQAAQSAKTIYLASDPDREGEAIAWHVAELVRGEGRTVRRIQFNEITARAVREALAHPRDLDENLFNSQQARRILDRIVGYKVSPLLWKKVKRGISAGRVQSVALKLIVDREKERLAFEPVEYWTFKARVLGPEPPAFDLELARISGKKAEVGSREQAEAVEAEARQAGFKVAAVDEKERARHPGPPFITSTLQQEANRRLGYTAKRTMGAAQRLYEGVDLGSLGTQALITYMRTDSTRIAQEALDAARDYILEAFGPDFYPEKTRVFKTRSSAQDAHEAIRPVDAHITPAQVKAALPADQYRLYKLIWERFVACQMAAARFWDTTVTAQAGKTEWKAKGERLLFAGYLAASGGEDKSEAAELPRLAAGDALALEEFAKDQKFTQPPARYSEASLVKELEDKGIGRPSTYATIIETLQGREYVRMAERRFAPTDLGTVVSDMLAEHFATLMDVGFTAGMEEALDRVAEGSADWVGLLKDFTGDFYPALSEAAKNMTQVKTGLDSGITCEVCGKPMAIKFGKAGTFLACTGYPACTNTKNFLRNDKGEIVIQEKEPQETQGTGRECPKCGRELVIKRTRAGGRFIACPGYPECSHAESLSTGVSCPREGCDGTLVEKSSKRGKIFYSCSNYPRCDYALWNPPVQEPCPACGFPILERKTTKAGVRIGCPQKACRYSREEEE